MLEPSCLISRLHKKRVSDRYNFSSVMNDPWHFLPCNYNSSELSSMYQHFAGIELPSTPRQVTPQIIQLPSTEPRTVELSGSNKLYEMVPQILPLLPFQMSERTTPFKPAMSLVSLVPLSKTKETQPLTPKQITQKPSTSGEVLQYDGSETEPNAKRKRELKPMIPPERISQRNKTQAKRDTNRDAGTHWSESQVLSPIKPGNVNEVLPSDASSRRLYRYLKPNEKAAAELNSVRCYSQAVAKKHRNLPNVSAPSTAGFLPSKNTQNQPPKDYYGCWTCRVRHCLCPADGKPCLTCIRYGYVCDNSPSRPSYIKCARKRKERIRYLQKMRHQ